MKTPTACYASTFPKAPISASMVSNEIAAVAHALNTGPCKTLDCRTPAEALDQLLEQDSVEVLRRPVESAQYASESYQQALEAAGLRGSMI